MAQIEAANGYFDDEAGEYVITTPDTPRDWYNYLWNDGYVALFSQTAQGESLAQDGVGRRIATVASRMFFLRDVGDGRFRSLNGLPVDAGRDGYRCRHGMGYSVIEQEGDGVASAVRCLVPLHGLCELWSVTLRNTGRRARRFALYAYFGTRLDGTERPQAYYQPRGRFDRRHQAVLYENPEHRFGDARTACIFLAADRRVTGYDTAAGGFIGHGTDQRPMAVVRGRCGNTDALMEKGCCALEVAMTVAPGRTATAHFVAGAGTSAAAVGRLCRAFLAPGAADRELARVRRQLEARLGRTRIHTPEARLDAFFHPWLKRQASLGTRWARVRHNGFRDQMQDIWALASIDAPEAERQLARVLAFQYPSGYAPRTWVDGQIQDKDFSDNHVWIASTVHRLVMETGNLALLDRVIPFNDGSSASLYEHVKRAVGFYWRDRGRHGLLRFRSGDWNDCLNGIGPRGRGVSVWLSMAWVAANRQFAELAERCGRGRDAATARQRGAVMTRLINRHGWDGAWYLRAYHDDGRPIGSHRDRRGTLFLLPQAWAVISGVADAARAASAMGAVDRLLECELGTRKVLHPFDRWDPAIGYASLKRPGVHENGGVYLHANCFKLMADCLLRRRERVAAALGRMLPFSTGRGRKACEPYVFCNSLFATPGNHRYGSTGQSWGTGTAAWFHTVLLDHVFGVRATFEGLRVEPCLPPGWRTCAMVRWFRGAEYRVTFTQARGAGRVRAVRVNGKAWTEPVLPWQPRGRYEVQVAVG